MLGRYIELLIQFSCSIYNSDCPRLLCQVYSHITLYYLVAKFHASVDLYMTYFLSLLACQKIACDFRYICLSPKVSQTGSRFTELGHRHLMVTGAYARVRYPKNDYLCKNP